MIESLVTFYGTRVPYHRGKWRVVQALQPWLRDSGTCTAVRQNVTWKLSLECLIQRSIYYLSVYEPAETRVLLDVLRPGDTFLDIGANIGYFSMLAASRGARVYSWEPVPHVRERFTENRDLNGFDISVFATALSNSSGTVEFQLPAPSNWGNGSIGVESGVVSRVPTERLDDALDLDSVRLIKIDVEGAEMQVLRGAENTIRRCMPTMLVEINPAALERMGSTAQELRDYLEALGYELLTPRLAKLQSLPGPEEYCNVVCRPRR